MRKEELTILGHPMLQLHLIETSSILNWNLGTQRLSHIGILRSALPKIPR